jgi:serine/threonine protein kinase
MNILIDDGGNAVLCDFGLSRVRSNLSDSTVGEEAIRVMGSRNWMAPERLLGRSLRNPCDIYSFGMTVYEVSKAIASNTLIIDH